MNPNPPSRLLHELSDERVPQDLNLLPRIRAQIETTNRAARKSAIRAAALLLTVVLLSVLFTRPAVVSALREMFGFIPGVGRVDQSAPLRVLASPATSTSGDYTLHVESAVLDANRTVIDYTITGAFPTWDDPALKPEVCVLTPLLRLPDGSELRWLSQENSPSPSGLQLQVIYPALPPSVDRAVLIFPCLPELPIGEGPQNWQLPLAFAPAPPDLTVYPVIDLPTTTPETAAAQGWMQLELQGAAVLEDGYYLQAALRWQEDPSIIEVEISPDALRLEDAAGQAVSVWFADQFPPPTPAEERSLALNLQTAAVTAPGPARLFVDYVIVRQPASARFTFDPGADPQPGQTWQLDQTSGRERPGTDRALGRVSPTCARRARHAHAAPGSRSRSVPGHGAGPRARDIGRRWLTQHGLHSLPGCHSLSRRFPQRAHHGRDHHPRPAPQRPLVGRVDASGDNTRACRPNSHPRSACSAAGTRLLP